MVKKLRGKVKNRILPFFLCFIFVFGFAVSSDVFTPKNARAIVGEEFIVPAFYAWLNTMNVYLSTYDSSPSDTQYLSNGIWNTLVNVANTQNWLSSAAWTLATLATELESRISTAFNDSGDGFFQIDQETSTLFDSATRQFIIDNSLSSDVSTPVDIDSMSGYFLADGTPIEFSTFSNGNVTHLGTAFSFGQYYFIYNNDNSFVASLVINQNNDGYTYSFTLNGNVAKTGNITGIDVSNDYYYFGENPNVSTGALYFLILNHAKTKTKVNFNTQNLNPALFSDSSTVGYSATTGTIVQNPDIPVDNEDEYGYVGVPNSIDWDSETTGNELIQSMLDYERDKPYSTESEYTYTISNEVPIQPEPDEPGMVELPLIGIQLPTNFSLNLRGIWYYVVQWINSITGFVGWMFGIFGNLPYAMVVPVYASAVIVIVLGVYKRFFM